MPGVVQGMLTGFSRALERNQGEQARQQEGERRLQMGVLNSLLGSNNPELQRLAVSAMTELATKPGKRAKGLQGFLGGREETTALEPVMEFLQRLEDEQGGAGGGGGPPGGGGGGYVGQPIGADAPETPAALPATSLVEGQAQAQTTPPNLFGAPSRRDERADVRREEATAEAASREQRRQDYADLGMTEAQIMEAEFRVRPQGVERPQKGEEMEVQTEDGGIWSALVNPVDGEVIQFLRPVPPERAKPGPRGITVTTRDGVFIKGPEFRGRVGDAPEGAPRDLPSYLNAVAMLKQIDEIAEAELEFASQRELNPGAFKEIRRRITRERFGRILEDVERAAGIKREDPGGALTPPPAEEPAPEPLSPADEILLELKKDPERELTPEEFQIVREAYPGLTLEQDQASSRAASSRLLYPPGAIEREEILGLMRSR